MPKNKLIRFKNVEDIILDFLRQVGPSTTSLITSMIDVKISAHTVRNRLRELAEQGHVKNVSSSSIAVWMLNEIPIARAASEITPTP